MERKHVDRPVIGVRYRVEWSDCCVDGSFEATLQDIDPDDTNPDLTFDNGARIQGWGYTITEAVEGR